jgi:hypothetical protein
VISSCAVSPSIWMARRLLIQDADQQLHRLIAGDVTLTG